MASPAALDVVFQCLDLVQFLADVDADRTAEACRMGLAEVTSFRRACCLHGVWKWEGHDAVLATAATRARLRKCARAQGRVRYFTIDAGVWAWERETPVLRVGGLLGALRERCPAAAHWSIRRPVSAPAVTAFLSCCGTHLGLLTLSLTTTFSWEHLQLLCRHSPLLRCLCLERSVGLADAHSDDVVSWESSADADVHMRRSPANSTPPNS